MVEDRIKKIEDYLLFLEKCEGKTGNMPRLERVSDYPAQVARVDYWLFVLSADHHYFVARVLFLKMVFEYSYFSAYQCVENYLKAYLKLHGGATPSIHSLPKLLERSRRIARQSTDFVDSEFAAIVARRFAPYYEVARYPVQHERPNKGQSCFLHPDDIYILDYFVYRMRQIVHVPEDTMDIFREGGTEGHPSLVGCMRNFPDFYEAFKSNNINFPGK